MIEAAATTGFDTADLPLTLLVGSLVLLVAVAAVRLANRSGLPTLLIYLAIGVALGEGGLGIGFENTNLTQVLGYCALILILIEGGLTTQWSSIRASVAPALLLSTLGVLVSVAVVGSATHLLLDFDWKTSLLLGAIVSSTDAAAVFSVLRKVPLPHRLAGVLEAESGFNDAPVVLLVVALADEVVPGGEHHGVLSLAGMAVFELAGGALVGLAVGWVLGALSQRIAPGSSGLFAIGVVAGGVLAYAAASVVHTSGFMATYLAALVLGNMPIPHRQAVRGFGQAMGWLAQIGLFVLLGLLASPSRLMDQFVPAMVVGFVLLLLARPASIIASMTPFGFSWREQVFLSWAGLRGAVPVVLATVPLTAGAEQMRWIFDLVFVLVVVFTFLQAPTLPLVARVLGIGNDAHAVELEVENTPLTELRADMLHVKVGEHSQLVGVMLYELRLPVGANVTLVVNGERSYVPGERSVLRAGDQLLVVTKEAVRARTLARFREVSEGGRLAGWRMPTAPRT